jgi:hypothetical protein
MTESSVGMKDYEKTFSKRHFSGIIRVDLSIYEEI